MIISPTEHLTGDRYSVSVEHIFKLGIHLRLIRMIRNYLGFYTQLIVEHTMEVVEELL